MIQRALGVLRSKLVNARATAPPPPKPVGEMNLIEITEYNKIPSKLKLLLIFHADCWRF